MMVTKKQNIDFGIVLTLVLLVVGLLFDVPVLLPVAVGALVVTALLPVLFMPFAWGWFKIAAVLEMLFSTILLSVIFYLVVTPVGILRRLFAKDTMNIRDFKKDGTSVFAVTDKKYERKDVENQF